MNYDATKDSVMKHLIQQAKNLGMWLHCNYQDLWFSPEELEREQAKGKFCWGPVNWNLRDPQERMVQIQAQIESLIQGKQDFSERLLR